MDQVNGDALSLRQVPESLGKPRLDPDIGVFRAREQVALLAASGAALTRAKEVTDRIDHLTNLVPPFPRHSKGLGGRFSSPVRAVCGHKPASKARLHLGDKRPKA